MNYLEIKGLKYLKKIDIVNHFTTNGTKTNISSFNEIQKFLGIRPSSSSFTPKLMRLIGSGGNLKRVADKFQIAFH